MSDGSGNRSRWAHYNREKTGGNESGHTTYRSDANPGSPQEHWTERARKNLFLYVKLTYILVPITISLAFFTGLTYALSGVAAPYETGVTVSLQLGAVLWVTGMVGITLHLLQNYRS
jgi:hypothetical protein